MKKRKRKVLGRIFVPVNDAIYRVEMNNDGLTIRRKFKRKIHKVDMKRLIIDIAGELNLL